MNSLSYKPTNHEEESAKRSEEMQRPGAAPSSTSFVPIAGTPKPAPSADAAQIRSLEAVANAAVKSPGEDARQPSSVFPPSVETTASDRNDRYDGADGYAFATGDGAAFAADLGLLLSGMEASTSGKDDESLLSPSKNYATYEAMEEGSVPNEGRGTRMIAQIGAEDEDNMEGEAGMEGMEDLEAEGGIENIDGGEAVMTPEQIAEAYGERDAAIKNLQSSARTLPPPLGIECIDGDEAPATPAQIAEAYEERDAATKNLQSSLRPSLPRMGIEYIDGDDAPVPPAQVAEAYEDMDAAIKNLQSGVRHVLPPLPQGRIAAQIAGANDEMDSAIKNLQSAVRPVLPPPSQEKITAQNGAAYSGMDVAELGNATTADEPPAEDEVTPMAPRPPPYSPAVPQAAGGRGQNLPTSGQRQAESPIRPPPRSMLASSNEAPDAESQSTEVSDAVNVHAPIEATLVQSVEATLILDDEGEVVIAERVSFVERTISLERKWKVVSLGVFIFLVILVVSLSVMLTKKETELVVPQSDIPSMQPSSPPSFDPRPTLEIVQTRGNLRCGLREYTVDSGEGLNVDMCRAIAAVLFGNPDYIILVPVSTSTAFQWLSDKTIDILNSGVTRTVEREVRERSTGAGFTFSSPYYYGGMAYFGDGAHVRCAEEQKRHNECTSLRICTFRGSTGYDFVQYSFPSDFYVGVTTFDESMQMLLNGTCNVLAGDRTIQSQISTFYTNFTLGDKLMTKDPLAIVTRNDDAEFSDVINWVVQSLFYGEEQGLTRDPSQCQSYPNLTGDVSDLIFTNAFYCVGNYGQILGAHYKINRGMNQINSGNTGMLYAFPFGELERNGGVTGDAEAIGDDTLLGRIKNKGSLNCGVVVPDGYAGEVMSSNKLVNMGVDYCHTLAAALFNGDDKAANISTFSGKENSSFFALNNGTIDVLAGARVEQKYDFRSSSPLLGGFHFSMPYYYGNEAAFDDVSMYSLATRDGNAPFSSFVNCVVLVTISVAEKIKKKDFREIPMASIFGSEFNWALRDAIAYSGSYDELYTNNFGDIAEEDRARNSLNDKGTPQIHSFPGIRQW